MHNNDTNYMISIDNLNEGIAVFRYKGDTAYLEYANSALCNLLHFSFEQLKGADYASILASVHPDDVEELWQMINSLPEKSTGKCTYRFKDFLTGENKWLTAKGQYLKDEKGHAAYFAYFDISNQIEAIEREQRLSRCIQLITDDSNFVTNMNQMVKCLREQYQAERAYIFEFDWGNTVMSNRIEVTANGVKPEIENLQDLPIDIIKYWFPHFKNGAPIFIDDLEAIKNNPIRKEEYEILAMQDIHSLMIEPIGKNGDLFGYVGVDNPDSHMGDREFLNNVAFILAQEYLAKVQQRKMIELSLMDPLTKINNRHAFNNKIEHIIKSNTIGIGVVFTDVNGLKYVNDKYGHYEGDNLIKCAVAALEKFFNKEELYRISGDEFVVIAENVAKEEFLLQVEKLKMAVSTEYGAIFSVGQVWNQNACDINELIKRAEEIMYDDKKAFYAKFPDRKRGY